MTPARRRRGPLFRILVLVLLAATVVLLVLVAQRTLGRLTAAAPQQPATDFSPPVLAGRYVVGGAGSAAVYARRDGRVYLVTTSHSLTPGTEARDPSGETVIGHFGSGAWTQGCPDATHRCEASDMSAIELLPDAIPWGHLNVIDMSAAGAYAIPAGTVPLSCDEIAIGDRVEVAGRSGHATGTVHEKGRYLFAEDGDSFPCMVATDVAVRSGDSGSVVLIRGIPAGVASRSFGGLMGFTPMREGLDALGLTLCTTPDCDLTPP